MLTAETGFWVVTVHIPAEKQAKVLLIPDGESRDVSAGAPFGRLSVNEDTKLSYTLYEKRWQHMRRTAGEIGPEMAFMGGGQNGQVTMPHVEAGDSVSCEFGVALGMD